MTYQTRVLDLTPAVYWKLDETSGTTMIDSSGNNRHGTYSGATLNQAALHPDAPRSVLAGSSGQGLGSIASAAWMGSTNTYTAAMWVQPNNTNDVRAIMSHYDASGGWVIWQRQGYLAFTVINASGQQDRYGKVIVVGTPVHLVFVQNGQQVRLILDGVEVYAGMVNGAYNPLTGPLEVGGYLAANYSAATFSDVAYWNRALSIGEIGYLFNNRATTIAALNPTGLAGLKGWYGAQEITGKVDGNTITSWTDLSGNGKHLTSSGTKYPIYKTNQLNGRPIVRFDGADDTLDVASIFASGTGIFTMLMFYTVRNFGVGALIPFSIQTGSLGHSMAINTSPGARGLFGVGEWITYSGSNTVLNTYEKMVTIGRGTGAVGYGSSLYADNEIIQGERPFTATGVNFMLGASSNQGGYSPMDVAEVLVFDRAVSEYELQGINAYLTNKWAIGVSNVTITDTTATATAIAYPETLNTFHLSIADTLASATATAYPEVINFAPIALTDVTASATATAYVETLLIPSAGALLITDTRATATASASPEVVTFGSTVYLSIPDGGGVGVLAEFSGSIDSTLPPPSPPIDQAKLPNPTIAPTLTESSGSTLLPAGTYRYKYAGWRGTKAQATAPSPLASITIGVGKRVSVSFPTIPGADGYLIYREDV